MRSLVGSHRVWVLSLLVALLAIVAPLRAEDAAPPTAVGSPWQESITGQIEAFRQKDAPAAFSFAGAGFQVNFPSAEVFFATIIGSGYAPIMDSRSHSFGAFQMVGEDSVIQEVTFTGTDQGLYSALYQMTEEPAGWRVQGVQLVKQQGLGV